MSVPDWANVRRNRSVGSAHRRLMVEPIIEKVPSEGALAVWEACSCSPWPADSCNLQCVIRTAG